MATEEITISELELADEVLEDMTLPVDTATETRAVTLKQLRAWLGSSLPTGFIIPAVGKISDERFTLLDGKTLSRAGTYEAFCNKVVSEVQAGNWFACSEDEYNSDISTYGQCGKFVVSNDYVRIPTITRFIGATITLSEIGKTYKESLPNITGEGFHTTVPIEGSASGAFSNSKITTKGVTSSGQAQGYGKLKINASLSSSTYQDNARVQPDHTKYPYYMVISTERQTASVEIDINKVYEDLNIKANTSLSNVTANIDFVVERYNDGFNWYRVYKSGWIEQGGLVGYGTAASDWNKVVNLLKPLSTNAKIGHYTLVVSDIGTSNNYARTCSAKLLNETSFTILSGMTWARDNKSQYACWRACGWGQSI